MPVGRNHGKTDGAPLDYHLVEEKSRFFIWPFLIFKGGFLITVGCAWKLQVLTRCPLTSLAGIGRSALRLLPTWPSLTPQGQRTALLLLGGGDSPDCPLGLYTTAAVRGKGASFLPGMDKNLFHYSAFSDTTLVGRWKHLIMVGQGMKSNHLTCCSMAGVGMRPLFWFYFPVVFGYSGVAIG